MSTDVRKSLVSLQRRQQFLYVGIFSLVTVMVWVSISLLLSQKSSQIPAALRKKASPLTPTINQQVLSNLEQKTGYSESELSNFTIYKLIITRDGSEQVVTIDTPDPRTLPPEGPAREPEPTPEPTPEPESSPTTDIDPAESASSSSEAADPNLEEPILGTDNPAINP
jgi:hypothetical protein